MPETWLFQVRIHLNAARAETARRDPTDTSLSPLGNILVKHNASLKCQYDAFADYCAAAEKDGVANYPLYQWTKDTLENPIKKEKYMKAFTLYISGEEVYQKEKADPIEADLEPQAESGLLEKLTKHDTNPAKNPQPPAKYHQKL